MVRPTVLAESGEGEYHQVLLMAAKMGGRVRERTGKGSKALYQHRENPYSLSYLVNVSTKTESEMNLTYNKQVRCHLSLNT